MSFVSWRQGALGMSFFNPFNIPFFNMFGNYLDDAERRRLRRTDGLKKIREHDAEAYVIAPFSSYDELHKMWDEDDNPHHTWKCVLPPDAVKQDTIEETTDHK